MWAGVQEGTGRHACGWKEPEKIRESRQCGEGGRKGTYTN